MSKISNRDLVTADKADLAVSSLVSNGGYLEHEQANKFIGLVYNEPTLLKQARLVKMGAPTRYIEKIGFGSRILHAAPSSGVTLDASKRGAPTTSKLELVTKERIAEIHIPYDVLEDNIEKGGLENTIMGHMATQVALDLEEAFLLGDTTSTDADLALQDGIIKRATSHTVSFSSGAMGKALFKKAQLEMPAKYQRNKQAMRFFISPNQEVMYRDVLADRQTATGDSLLETNRAIQAFGVPVESAALIPDTKMLFVEPKNMIWGIQRDIMVETDRDIRSRVFIVVLTLRSDFAVEDEAGMVVITDIASPA